MKVYNNGDDNNNFGTIPVLMLYCHKYIFPYFVKPVIAGLGKEYKPLLQAASASTNPPTPPKKLLLY